MSEQFTVPRSLFPVHRSLFTVHRKILVPKSMFVYLCMQRCNIIAMKKQQTPATGDSASIINKPGFEAKTW